MSRRRHLKISSDLVAEENARPGYPRLDAHACFSRPRQPQAEFADRRLCLKAQREARRVTQVQSQHPPRFPLHDRHLPHRLLSGHRWSAHDATWPIRRVRRKRNRQWAKGDFANVHGKLRLNSLFPPTGSAASIWRNSPPKKKVRRAISSSSSAMIGSAIFFFR